MITLTTPPTVNSVLGNNSPVAFQKMVIGPFTLDSLALAIQGTITITSTTVPSMAPIVGTLRITTSTATLEISVPQIDFYRKVTLTGPQNNAVQTIIRDAQNALEAGLISLGVVAGTQSVGS